MDRGKTSFDCSSRANNFIDSRNNKIYMDLKDIIREHALPFLPAKSLFRFQGVCRDWKLWISTPFFAYNQSFSFHTFSGIFLQSPGNPPSFVSIDPKSCGMPDPTLKFLPEPVDIRSSSNGLLCSQGCDGDKAYYICNPVTKQWKKIPKPNGDHGPDPAVVLIFEPSLLNFVANYKLICAFPSADFDNAIEFEIYSSIEGSWKISGEIFFANRKLMPKSGIHVNGVVYWQVKHSRIVAFDLRKDRAQLIHGFYGVKGLLGEVDGKLCSAYVNSHSIMVNVLSNVYSNTMQMNSNARTWEEKDRIQLDNSVFGEFAVGQAIVVFVGGNVVLVQAGRTILSHDTKNKETTVLCSAAENGTRCVSYVNSLVYI